MTRSTAPPSRKAGHVGPRSGHPARITARRTLSWYSRPTNPPGGTFRFPPSLRRSTASKGRFLGTLVVPEVAQLSHPYTSITRGRASPPRGSGIASQSRAPSPRAPSAPRAGSACGSYASCADATPDPRAAGAAAIRAGSARGSRAAGAGQCGGRRAGGGPAGRGARGVGGGSGPPCRGRCFRWAGGGGWRGAPASGGYQGGCTTPPGRPPAGAPRPPSLVPRPALPSPPPCPVLPAPGGPPHPSPPCPWAPCLPPAPGSGALPPL